MLGDPAMPTPVVSVRFHRHRKKKLKKKRFLISKAPFVLKSPSNAIRDEMHPIASLFRTTITLRTAGDAGTRTTAYLHARNCAQIFGSSVVFSVFFTSFLFLVVFFMLMLNGAYFLPTR